MNFKTIPSRDTIVIIGAGKSTKTHWNKALELAKKHCTIIPNTPNDKLAKYCDYNLFLDDPLYHKNKDHCKNKIIIGDKIIIGKGNRSIKRRLLFLAYHRHGKRDKIVIRPKDGYIKHMVGNAGFASILCSVYFRPKKIYLIGFDGPDFTRVKRRKLFIPHYHAKRPGTKGITMAKINRTRNHLRRIIQYIHGLNVKIEASTTMMWGLDLSEWCTNIR